MKKMMLAGLMGSMLLIGAAADAAPQRNVSAKRHPNLAGAQRFANDAYQKIVAAQKANEFDLGGHAEKAKQLLEEASRELKAAAEAANSK